jgi:hypothetical protein
MPWKSGCYIVVSELRLRIPELVGEWVCRVELRVSDCFVFTIMEFSPWIAWKLVLRLDQPYDRFKHDEMRKFHEL